MSKNMRVARNILALLVNQLGTWTITLVLTLVIPHYLGVDLYGVYSFVSTYIGFLTVFIGLGTSTYLTWRIAREPEQAARLTFNTLALQVPLGIALGCGALLLLPRIDSTPLAMHLSMLGVISTVLAALTATCVAALGGFQLMRTPAFIGLGFSVVGTLLIIVCVALNLGIIALAIVGVINQIIGFAAILIYTQRKIHMRPRVDLRLWRVIVAGGLPFFAWSAVLLFYWQIDVPLLKILGGVNGNAEVAWYALANRVIGIPVFLPTIIITAILPALSRERDATSAHFRELASRSIRLVALVNVPACVGTILLANSIPALLRFSYQDFGQISPLIVILAFNMPLVALDMVLGTVLIAQGRQKAWTLVGVVAAVLNPLANLWVIPLTQHLYGNGAIGASLTTIMSEVIMFIGAMILRPRTVFTLGDMFYIARCLFAACIMIPAVWALSSLPIFVERGSAGMLVAVAYGIVIYAMAAYTMQVIRNSDIQGIVSVVGARMGIGEISTAQLRHLLTRFNISAASSSAKMSHASASISRPLVRLTQPPIAFAERMAEPLVVGARRVTSRPLHSMAHGATNAFVAAEHPDIGPDIYGAIPAMGDSAMNGQTQAASWYAQEEAELLDIAQITTDEMPTPQRALRQAASNPDGATTEAEPTQPEQTLADEVDSQDTAAIPTQRIPAVAFTDVDKQVTAPAHAAPRLTNHSGHNGHNTHTTTTHPNHTNNHAHNHTSHDGHDSHDKQHLAETTKQPTRQARRRRMRA